MPGVGSRCCLSQQWGWGLCFSSLAPFSRYTHQRQPHSPILLPRVRQWQQCFTSTFASIRWDGARCHGCTRLIFFQRGPDTMGWLSHLRRSGCGASVFLMHPLANIYRLTILFADYVVAKVTPTIHTRLGYKMFLMFACLNVGAMAPFSLYDVQSPCFKSA
jgi:hypothetical protein